MGYEKSQEKEKKSINNFNCPNVANRNRPPYHVQTNAVEVEKTLAKPSHQSRRVGKGSNPCWVCSSNRHIWYNYEKKKKKGSYACCGSMVHITRDCAQRYFPASYSAGKSQNVQKEASRNSRKSRNSKQRDVSVESVQESNDKSSKRESKSKKKTRSKCSVSLTSSSSSSEDGDSSDSASEKRRLVHRCSYQRISDVRDLPATSSSESSVSSLQKKVSSVASKAVLDWPNI